MARELTRAEERAQWIKDNRSAWFRWAASGHTIVIPKDWCEIGFAATRQFARELKAVAGANRVVDNYAATSN